MLRLLTILLLMLLPSCTTIHSLRQDADALALSAGMHPVEIPTVGFTLLAYDRISDPQAPVRVYIEGDGNAWLTRSEISPNPTPHDPMALKLAIRDNTPNVAYIARPCQYIVSAQCAPKYWSSAEYSESVIASVSQALNRWHGKRIELVGYSGGAAVVLLVAARRDDVIAIRTVAGNLDTDAFTQFHHVSPLTESLNPASMASRTAMIPQIHFTGSNDTIVPYSLVAHYQKNLPKENCSAHAVVAHADHYSGWAEQWPTLLTRPLPCTTSDQATPGWLPIR